MINIDKSLFRAKTLIENKHFSDESFKRYNDFVSLVNEITFTSMDDSDLNENDMDNVDRDKVIELINRNDFEVNNYESFMNSLFKSSRKEYLTQYTIEDFEKMTTYKLKNYDIGYAIKSDGDIVSVFNNSNVRGIGKQLVSSAIKNGGTKLDHYEGYLSSLYEPLGFKEVERYKWDDQYAPKGWDYDKHGTPDVVMRQLER